MGGTEKSGGKTKILKRGGGGKLGQGVVALKRGWGLEPPYELCIILSGYNILLNLMKNL